MLSICPDATEDPVLTTREVAGLLGVAVSTVQLWIEDGALPAWKTPGGHRRVRLSAVQALLRTRSQDKRRAAPAAAMPLAGGEAARLAALAASGLDGSAAEPVFDRLTWLAAEVTGSPIALLSVVAARRLWFKSRVGVPALEAPRADTFCSVTIMQDGPMMVTDARLDARFCDTPLVRDEPQLRFYAGFPLAGRGGHRLGALCVMDREPRRLRQRELRALGELAAIAGEEIRRR